MISFEKRVGFVGGKVKFVLISRNNDSGAFFQLQRLMLLGNVSSPRHMRAKKPVRSKVQNKKSLCSSELARLRMAFEKSETVRARFRFMVVLWSRRNHFMVLSTNGVCQDAHTLG